MHNSETYWGYIIIPNTSRSPSRPPLRAHRKRESREDVLTRELRSKMEFSVSNTDLPKFENARDVKRPL